MRPCVSHALEAGKGRINAFLAKYAYPIYLPCIKKFGLPSSVSCPVDRNVNDEECLPLASVSKGRGSLCFKFRVTFTLTKY